MREHKGNGGGAATPGAGNTVRPEIKEHKGNANGGPPPGTGSTTQTKLPTNAVHAPAPQIARPSPPPPPRSGTSTTARRCPTGTTRSARSSASTTAACAATTAPRGTGRQAEVPAGSTLLRSVAPSCRCLRPRSKLLRYASAAGRVSHLVSVSSCAREGRHSASGFAWLVILMSVIAVS